ncbi:MAG TPA: VWA domain-containing protein [Bryobacteraceae bacterium]|nr:VWA domain-containing protein [Bryobacteraceae bacterium]
MSDTNRYFFQRSIHNNEQRSRLPYVAVAAGALCLAFVPALRTAENAEFPGEPRVSITPRAPRPSNANARNPATIRLDVKAVLVPVTVTDAGDRPVEGLRKEDFQVFEDDVKQQIISYSMEDVPASVGLVFDSSGSMSNKIIPSVDAVEQFFQTTLPGDEFALVRFSDRPQFIGGFTPNIGEVSRWLHSLRAAGWTALNDAIYLGIQKMKGAKNARKVILVLSDGGDNNSRYSSREIRELVREAGVGIYSISFYQGSRLLEGISDETGGRLIHVHHLSDLPGAIEKLSRAIRSQYVLSYYSTKSQNDGKYHRVRVALNQPALRISWRHGYYAPLD